MKVGKGVGKLAVAMLLVVFVFSLGNLVFNLENLNIGAENVPDFYNPGVAQNQTLASHSTISNALRWIYYGFLGFCILVTVIGVITFASSKDKAKWRRLFVQMAAILLVVGLIFVFGYFYEDIEGSITGSGSTDMLPGGDVGTGSNDTVQPESPEALNVVLTFGIFAVVFLFCIALLMGLNNFLRMRSANLDYSDLERDTREMVRTIQRTIDDISRGSDTRATVIRCYTDMCKVLAKHGVEEEEHLTPREFQRIATEKLPIPENEMGALVAVFEEARYSQHELGDDAGPKAVHALQAVKRTLLKAVPEGPKGGGD